MVIEMHDLVELITLITREVLKNLGENNYHSYGHPEVNNRKPTLFPGKLVVEKDVIDRRKESKYLYISKKSIVTPLALDKAKEIGLIIERKDA